MDPNNPTPKPTPMEALLQRIAFHQREASDAEAALRQMLNNQMAEVQAGWNALASLKSSR